MPRYTEKIYSANLSVIPLRGTVAFPSIPLSIEIPAGGVSGLIDAADKLDEYVFAVAQRDIAETKPEPNGLYRVGTIAKIKQAIKLPDGGQRVILEGTSRASVTEYTGEGGIYRAELLAKTVQVEGDGGIKGEALIGEGLAVLEEFITYLPRYSPDLLLTIKAIRSPGFFADVVGSNMLVNFTDKQKLLEEFDPMRRAELLSVIMESEIDILKLEQDIHNRVREQIDDNQRGYYLREQLKAIQNELGNIGSTGGMDGGDFDYDNEIEEYNKKIRSAHLPKEVEAKLYKEVKKLAKSPFNSAESGVQRNYLDACLEIPWTRTSKDRTDIEAARKVLDRDHDGLERVKERILEFLAVRQLNPDIRNQIICLVGPPGTGKTSIGRSIATATKRKYVRVSLGGIHDESDIRGHRKTYIGSMPGRIITALVQAGTRNPVMVLDEVDKLTADAHGDPASALLEVLDGEQNKAFRDHFIELPVDLSDVMFIATANTLDTVPRPLIDRMEIIELKIYTRHEKLSIAKNHLIPKQLKNHGMTKRMLKISDDAVFELIDFYTSEAGVRNLERQIASLCRKAAKEIIESGEKNIVVRAADVSKYLGVRKVLPEHISDSDEVGVVNGLAYTELGGDILKIEVAAMEGTGKLELTGSLGDVMKESCHAAVTYIRSHARELGVDPEFYKNRDIHIHVPEGAIPKDGPSAGVTIMTALTSELTGIPVRRDLAMTGEITLRGHVLPIGGLKEKTMAAYKLGVRTVLIPDENKRDLEEIDPVVRAALEFVPVKSADEVLAHALVRPAAPKLPVVERAAQPADSQKNMDILPIITEPPAADGITTHI